jgi:excisionase family DNA binding protein
MTSRSTAPSWVSVLEAAKVLGCHRNTVYDLLYSGVLRGAQLRPNSFWRVSRESVEELAARMEHDLGRNGDSPS